MEPRRSIPPAPPSTSQQPALPVRQSRSESSSVKEALIRLRLIGVLPMVVLVLLYGAYVSYHVADGLAANCNSETILYSLFPVRQLYTVPRAEQGMREILAKEPEPTGHALADALAPAIIAAMEGPVLELVKHGHCSDMMRLSR